MELKDFMSYCGVLSETCACRNRYLRIDVQPNKTLLIYCPTIIPTTSLDTLSIKSPNVYEIHSYISEGEQQNIKIHVERKRDSHVILDVRDISVHSYPYAEEEVKHLVKTMLFCY